MSWSQGPVGGRWADDDGTVYDVVAESDDGGGSYEWERSSRG